jgi:hypothetical protein
MRSAVPVPIPEDLPFDAERAIDQAVEGARRAFADLPFVLKAAALERFAAWLTLEKRGWLPETERND